MGTAAAEALNTASCRIILFMLPSLPSALPRIVVASPDISDAKAINSVLDAYVRPFRITPYGYDQFASTSTGQFTFNLLCRYFETGEPAPTVFVSSALEDGRGWVYTNSLVPGFYLCLGAGSAGPDAALDTTRGSIEMIEAMLAPHALGPAVSLAMLSPEQLRMLDVYRRCGRDWDKAERFLAYGKQMNVVELLHKSQPFLHTINAVRAITKKSITSRIPHLDDVLLAYLYSNEAG